MLKNEKSLLEESPKSAKPKYPNEDQQFAQEVKIFQSPPLGQTILKVTFKITLEETPNLTEKKTITPCR